MAHPALQAVQKSLDEFNLEAATQALDSIAPPDIDDQVLLLRARAERLSGRYEEAGNRLAEAIQRYLDAAPLRAEQALVRFAQGRYEDALVCATEVDAKTSDGGLRAIAASVKAGVCRRRNYYDGAMAILSAALEKRPADPVLLAERATLLATRDNPSAQMEQAWSDLHAVVTDGHAPDNAWVALAMYGEKNGEVANLLNQQYESAADKRYFRSRLAQFYSWRNDNDLALDWAQKDPESEFARLTMAIAYRDLGKHDEAIAVLRAASKDAPSNLRIRFHLADLLLRKGDYASTLALVGQEPLDSLPEELIVPRLRARRRSGDLQTAVNEAQQLVIRAKSSHTLQEELAYLFAVARDFKSAGDVLATAGDTQSLWTTRILTRILEGNFVEAHNAFLQARAKFRAEPGADILALGAWLMANDGNFAEASLLLDHAKSVDSLAVYIPIVQVEVLIMQGDLAQALGVATLALKRHSESVDLRLDIAQIHLTRKNYAAAITFAEEAYALDQSLTMPIQLRSFALLHNRRFAEAAQLLDDALLRFGESAGLRACRGYLRLRMDDTPESARGELERALTLPGAGVIARTALGAIALRGRDYATAEARFREAQKIQPFSLDAKTNLAWALIAGGDGGKFAEAEQLCREVLQRNPTDVRALNCLAARAYRERQSAHAEALLRLAEQSAPDDVDTLVNLGGSLARTGKYEEAESRLQRALRLEPNHARALVELAKLNNRLGKLTDARRWAQAATASSPDVAATWRVLAATYVAEGQPSKGADCLRRALGRVADSERRSVRLELARLLLDIADPKPTDARLRESITNLECVLDETPDASEPLLLRGLAELKLERPSSALTYLSRVYDPQLRGYVAGMEQEARQLRASIMERLSPTVQYILGGILLVQIAFLWIGQRKWWFNESTFVTLLPIFTALLVLSVLLPRLTSFKVANFEAQMSLPPRDIRQETLVGPTAEIDIEPSLQPAVGTMAYDL